MIEMWCSYVIDKEFSDPSGWELQNMLLVSRLIVVSASKRKGITASTTASIIPRPTISTGRNIL